MRFCTSSVNEKQSAHVRVSSPTHLRLAQLSDLELFEDLRGGEDAGVDDAGDGEGAADDGADRRHEVVQRRPRLVVLHRYRV